MQKALTILCGLWGVAFCAWPARAQNPGPGTRTLAIVNARIVPVSGPEIPRGTIVIRDGLILAVGPNVTVPADADTIDGGGLTVYPGFIDGRSFVGIPRSQPAGSAQAAGARPPTAGAQPRVFSGDPTPEQMGLRPTRLALEEFQPADASVRTWREAGFTAAVVTSREGFLAGKASLLLLGSVPDRDRPFVGMPPWGYEAEALALKPEVGVFAQFQSARGVYPGTTMAVMAMIRQLGHDARYLDALLAAYERDPNGRPKPVRDPVREALIPVYKGQVPVLFEAPDARSVWRALNLAQEVGWRIVLTGVEQPDLVLDRLRTARVPVALSLRLPREADTSRAAQERRRRASEEMRRLLDRQEQARKARLEAYAQLLNSDLPVALATANVEPAQIRTNLRRLVEAGASKEAVLRALTLNAARIYGVERQLGSLEPGKIANLVVTRGDYFDRDAQVRYVFVAGERFSVEARPAPAGPGARPPAAARPAAGETANLQGAWSLVIESPQGALQGRLELEQNGSSLTGRISVNAPIEVSLLGGRVSGSEVVLEMAISFQGQQFAFPMRGTVSGDIIAGSFPVPGGGSGQWSARRIPN
ncbi:MAG: amidohydrolase family protein [Bacteroidota bacterium]|nr:amidohydrolase family protein [Bacteroidota bacterium]MDW8138319.1 amidohydrolase family protein [Bacteroidota bacterium]